jgi:trimeric autotransporter adhesin
MKTNHDRIKNEECRTQSSRHAQFWRQAWLCFCLLPSAFCLPAWGQGTAFTYQGRLNNGGVPANGIYDLQFTIYDLATNGTLLAGPVTNSTTGVSNGLFTVRLDFGATPFTGADRWLDIAVRTNGVGAFNVLTPRQPLTPAPYAIMTANAARVSGLFVQQNTNGAPNLIGGSSLNQVDAGVVGAVIAGGDTNDIQNHANYSAIAGGSGNLIQSGAALSSIGGGLANTNGSSDAVIAGGYNNLIQPVADLSVIGGGWLNRIEAGADQSVIAGGNADVIQSGARESFVGGGFANIIQTNSYNSFIGAGAGNVIGGNSPFSTITAGANNSIQTNTSFATVGGGNFNSIQPNAPYATIGGGYNNTIQTNAPVSTIGGGHDNTVQSAPYVTIGGGGYNLIQANAYDSMIGGGGYNNIQADTHSSAIGGGASNTIQTNSPYSTIGGGYINTISPNAPYATIGGGTFNYSFGNAPTVAGGGFNLSGNYASVGGGYGNAAGAVCSTVSGGSNNVAYGYFATVGGGDGNTGIGTYAVVGGGYSNSASGYSAAVAGGYLNNSGDYGTVGGGVGNTSSGNSSTVAGGAANTSSGSYATVGGGYYNHSTALLATVDGGEFNTASNTCATVSGGYLNTAGGYCSFIAGGANNSAVGTNSFAAGNQAQANHQGSFVWADSQNSPFASTTNDQFNVRAQGGVRLVTSGAGITLDGQPLLSGSSSLNANNLVSGTVPDARLSTNVALRNASQTFTGANTFSTGQLFNGQIRLDSTNGFSQSSAGNFYVDAPFIVGGRFTVLTNGNVGIGTNNPQSSLHVNNEIRWGRTNILSLNQSGSIELGDSAQLSTTPFIDFHFGVAGSQDYNTRIINDATAQLSIFWVGSATPLARFNTGGLTVNGTFVSASDRNAKENFQPVSARQILDKVTALPITRWNYKNDPATPHVGPMAQDFYAAFSVGPDDKHIAVVDEGGVALAAIQGLDEKVEVRSQKSDVRIQKLEAQNMELERENGSLEKRLETLEQIILSQKSN